jgi:hypothetical protein
MDRRAEILLKETGGIFDEHEGGITGIFNAMDEYMRECCLSLLQYMAEKKMICSVDEKVAYFLTRGECLNKEEVLRDFL